MSFFAIGIWHPKWEVNTGSLWRSADIFGAAFLFTVGRRYQEQASDTTHASRRIPLLHFTDLADLHAHLPYSCPLVGMEMEDDAHDLRSFRHPARAAYLLGAEDHGLSPAVAGRCHYLVKIPVSISLNVAAAGSVLMYDRTSKEAACPRQ